MSVSLECSVQTFERLQKFMNENPNASWAERSAQLDYITANPTEGYVPGFDDKLEGIRARFVCSLAKLFREEEKTYLDTRGDISKTVKKLFSKEMEAAKVYRKSVKKIWIQKILVNEENQEKALKLVKKNVKEYLTDVDYSDMMEQTVNTFLSQHQQTQAVAVNTVSVGGAATLSTRQRKSGKPVEVPEQTGTAS